MKGKCVVGILVSEIAISLQNLFGSHASLISWLATNFSKRARSVASFLGMLQLIEKKTGGARRQ